MLLDILIKITIESLKTGPDSGKSQHFARNVKLLTSSLQSKILFLQALHPLLVSFFLSPIFTHREDFVVALDQHLKQFWPEAELALFGSSANGFSFRQADLDISLAFRHDSRYWHSDN